MPVTRTLGWHGSPYMKLSELLEFTHMITNSLQPEDDTTNMTVHFRIDPGSSYPGDAATMYIDCDLP